MSDKLREKYDGGIFDLDGVCYRGAEVIAGAPEAIAEAEAGGFSAIYLTNNASRPAGDVADHLGKLGIKAAPEAIYTSARAAAELAEERFAEGSKILVIGGKGLREELSQRGFEIVSRREDEPAAVIQGWDASVGWAELSEGALAIRDGAIFIATNLDATLPQERGFMLGNGSLVKAVEHATGVSPVATGKPTPQVFRRAAEAGGLERPLAIGDRLDTDVAGAVEAGMDCLHVLTGVTTATEVAIARPGQRPTYLGIDLSSLSEPYQRPRLNGGRAELSGQWAKVSGGTVETSGDRSEADLALYRCIVAACWEAIDAGTHAHQLAPQLADLHVVGS